VPFLDVLESPSASTFLYRLSSQATISASVTAVVRWLLEAVLDGLGFRVRQSDTSQLFEVYAPLDRTGTARFSEGLGNLRSVAFRRAAPTLTHAVVAGSGDLDERIAVEVANSSAASEWWRVEAWLDESGIPDDLDGELTQAGQGALEEGSQLAELVTETVDTDDLQAGRDFQLGDRVTVVLPTGLEITDVVRAIHLKATPGDGEYVTSTIGSPEATTDTPMVRRVRRLGQRLGRTERR
jgi:hypothetical protein